MIIPSFSARLLVLAGLPWSFVQAGPGTQARKPDESRFTPVVVIAEGQLEEPMAFEVLPDGTVYVIERKGGLKMYDPKTRTTKLVATLAVNTKYTNAAGQQREAEEGLFGFTLDPNFQQNHWAYFLYAHPTVSKHVLSRMELRGDSLLMETEKVLLEYTTQRETCCHTGGGMTWDARGNLYITVGNNTGNSVGSQTDERPGRENWDDQRGAANTNDLRGKILRIHPEPDGSYTIPSGNLFPPGTPRARPEVYIMGLRNPWRVSIDSRTGYLYWGEVGPDAAQDAPNTVAGEDELNQARGPGFFGWPYFIGANRAYPITDYVTGRILPPKDPRRPINDSRNNTGLRELPPAQPAFISYPYGVSERFPEVGTGGRCAVGGPIYHRADLEDPARPWPEYYEGKWFVADCSRNWIMAITMDAEGDYVSMERFLPAYTPVEPLDLKFGPDGDLYVLEYGSIWFAKSPDSRLVRIEYNGGNRPPVVVARSSAKGGAVPFSVTLSAEGTADPDGDPLRYEWRVAPASGGPARRFRTAGATVSFDRPGVYTATLTVTDAVGARASQSLRIVAGNEAPSVAVEVAGSRSFFFPGRAIEYRARVSDKEDGAISPDRVALSIDYVPEDFDVAALAQGDREVDASTRFAVARAIMATTDCRACHQETVRSAGPSFREIATRYRGDAAALTRLVQKVRSGGSGVWGETNMPAHPGLSVAEATALVRYILSLTGDAIPALPLRGRYTPEIPPEDGGRGRLIIRAVYTDGGVAGLPPQTSEQLLVLRSPELSAGTADVISNAATSYNRNTRLTSVVPRRGGYIGFRGLDLTGIRQVELGAQATARRGHVGGTIEIRLDSPTGELLGRAEVAAPQPRGPAATQLQEAGRGAQAEQAARRNRGAPGRPRGGAAPPLAVDLRPTTGTHDLYFVFKNDAARPIDPLMVVTRIRLNDEEARARASAR